MKRTVCVDRIFLPNHFFAHFCFAVVLAVFASTSASAQEATTAQAPAWFKQADKNADGKLSRDEAPNKEVFGDVDTDQDGFASLSEVNAWLSTRPASNPSPNNKPPQARQDRAQLPDDVEKRSVTIWSDGTRMAGDLYLPKNRDAKDKFPAIVLCA